LRSTGTAHNRFYFGDGALQQHDIIAFATPFLPLEMARILQEFMESYCQQLDVVKEVLSMEKVAYRGTLLNVAAGIDLYYKAAAISWLLNTHPSNICQVA
jgi:hypothetical protein